MLERGVVSVCLNRKDGLTYSILGMWALISERKEPPCLLLGSGDTRPVLNLRNKGYTRMCREKQQAEFN